MITKEELLKLLQVAQREKAMLDGKIELLVNQMRMISQKELQLKEAQKKEVKKEE